MEKVINTMVDRFLCWKLPKDFAPDCGISFDGRKDDEWNKNKTWPVGTNLLTAEQAKQMFVDVMPTDSEFLSLEKQYCERLGELARQADIVCTWITEHYGEPHVPDAVIAAIDGLKEYIEAVRPEDDEPDH